MNREPEIREALQAEGGVFERLERKVLSWRCARGHERRQSVYDFLKGRRCPKCKRVGKIPRAASVPAVGARSGDLEVVEYLGVIRGHSTCLVRNVTNTRSPVVMRVADFKRQKAKLLDAAQVREVLVKNGRSRRGQPNSKNATSTWADVHKLLSELGFASVDMPPPTLDMVTSVVDGIWKVRCHCGATFSPRLNNILTGNTSSCGCVRSHAQKEVESYLASLGLEVYSNRRDIVPPLELDAWIPSIRLAVEYCGLYWHGEVLGGARARKRHLEKLEACRTAGIRLVTIFEDEWISKRRQVEAYLRSIASRGPSVGARKCDLVVVDSTPARAFLDANHLQGAANGLHLGLRLGEELVALATFSRPNASRARGSRPGEWELARYCVSTRPVQGGLSKLLKGFRREKPEAARLVSYSDDRWSDGSLYRALGFEPHRNPPSYWYFRKHEPGVRLHRYGLRKQVLVSRGGDPLKTEWQLAQEAGFDRVWDCGSTRWELDLRPT